MAAVRLALFFAFSTLYVTNVSSLKCYFCVDCPSDPSQWEIQNCAGRGASYRFCVASSNHGKVTRGCYNEKSCRTDDSNFLKCTCETDLCNDKDYDYGRTTVQPKTTGGSTSLDVSFMLLTFVAVLTCFFK